MGTTLTGTTPQDTYDSLIKVTDNGPISGTAKFLSDGLGNDSALALSTAAVGIGTTTTSSVGSTKVLEIGTSSSGGTVSLGGSSVFRITGTASGVDMFYAASAPISIYTNSAERVKIDATGNVGIGAGAPAAKLEVSSTDLSSIFVTNPTTSGATTGSGIGLKAYNGTSVAQYGSIVLTSNTWSFGTYSPQQLSIGSDGTGGVAVRSTLSAPITFHTGGTFSGEAVERVRITSNGLSFNGDTAAANALDDYEEGTWTPVFTMGTSGTITMDTVLGRYTKIGNLVTCTGFANVASSSLPVGELRIGGLPFVVGTAGDGALPLYVYSFGNTTAVSAYQAFTIPSLSFAPIRGFNNGAQIVDIGANVVGGAGAIFTITYRV
jgi:hypothetical protein